MWNSRGALAALNSASGSSPSFPAVLQDQPVENEKIHSGKAKWKSVCSLKKCCLGLTQPLAVCFNLLRFYCSEKGKVLVMVHCVQSLGKENKLQAARFMWWLRLELMG